jgi:outer membrane protein W
MRKSFLFAVIALSISFAQAQFKPTGGTFAMEVQFRPLGYNLIENKHTSPFLVTNDINVYGLSARYFCVDQVELRADLFFGFNSQKNKTKDTTKGKETQIETDASTLFGLNLGVNYHFKGTERVSPYIGAVVGLGFMNETNKITNLNYIADDSYKATRGGLLVNFAVASGFNWYIVDGLYLGAEIGLGVEYVKETKSKFTSKIGQVENTIKRDPEYSEFGLGFYANPAIRLGWKF